MRGHKDGPVRSTPLFGDVGGRDLSSAAVHPPRLDTQRSTVGHLSLDPSLSRIHTRTRARAHTHTHHFHLPQLRFRDKFDPYPSLAIHEEGPPDGHPPWRSRGARLEWYRPFLEESSPRTGSRSMRAMDAHGTKERTVCWITGESFCFSSSFVNCWHTTQGLQELQVLSTCAH